MKLAPAGPGDVSTCEASHGLTRRPFGVTADPRFTYASRSHSSAFEAVTDALRRGEGLVVVTGRTGTGKTMLCRALVQTFDRRTFLSVVLDPRLTVNDLFQQLLVDFGLVTRTEPPARRGGVDRHQFVSALQRFLSGLIPVGGHAVVVIDEAQHLDPDVLEEIRLLSNFDRGDATLLQIVLVGQPDLDAVLRRPDMHRLAQRVARRIELHPLSADEVPEYIERRLLVASGGDGPADVDFCASAVRFSAAAVRGIARISGGIPRVINTLCDKALENAFDRQADEVDRAAVMTAARQLKLRAGILPNLPASTRVVVAACACVACAAAASLWSSTTGDAPSNARADAPVARTIAADPIATDRSPSDPPAHPATAGPTEPAGPPTLRSEAPGSDNTGAFEIAVAAFRTAQRAEEVADAIAQTGLPTSTRSDPAGWHQIVVGPLGSAEAAESVQKELAREGFPSATISVSRPERR